MTDHPITPPPELVQQWINEEPGIYAEHIAARAAQWGADQELEACCQWISDDAEALRIVRRPKPPSLAEEALEALDLLCEGPNPTSFIRCKDTIRRALERLQELEDGN